MSARSKAEMRRQLGASARQIDRELSEFRDAAQVLSSDHPRLIDQYAGQWVGVYQGAVAAQGKSLPALMRQLAGKGIAANKVLIRHIERAPSMMIL